MFLGVCGACEAILWVVLGNRMMRDKIMAVIGNGLLGSGFRTGFKRTVIQRAQEML